jgi:hypothetical protein
MTEDTKRLIHNAISRAYQPDIYYHGAIGDNEKAIQLSAEEKQLHDQFDEAIKDKLVK